MKIICFIIMVFFLFGCAPEVGSERWCKLLDETPKGDWSANDATEYAGSCVFGRGD